MQPISMDYNGRLIISSCHCTVHSGLRDKYISVDGDGEQTVNSCPCCSSPPVDPTEHHSFQRVYVSVSECAILPSFSFNSSVHLLYFQCLHSLLSAILYLRSHVSTRSVSSVLQHKLLSSPCRTIRRSFVVLIQKLRNKWGVRHGRCNSCTFMCKAESPLPTLSPFQMAFGDFGRFWIAMRAS